MDAGDPDSRRVCARVPFLNTKCVTIGQLVAGQSCFGGLRSWCHHLPLGAPARRRGPFRIFSIPRNWLCSRRNVAHQRRSGLLRCPMRRSHHCPHTVGLACSHAKTFNYARAAFIDRLQNCNIFISGWNEQEWQDKTNAILGNPNLQGIAWEFIPGTLSRAFDVGRQAAASMRL